MSASEDSGRTLPPSAQAPGEPSAVTPLSDAAWGAVPGAWAQAAPLALALLDEAGAVVCV